MIRLTLTSLLAGLCLAVAIASIPTSSASARGARTTPQGSPTNPDGTSGAPVNTIAPTLNLRGTVGVGRTLTCAEGIWANDPIAYRERWRRAHKLVHTGASYRTVRADAGHTVACYVTATNAQGSGSPTLAGSVKVRR